MSDAYVKEVDVESIQNREKEIQNSQPKAPVPEERKGISSLYVSGDQHQVERNLVDENVRVVVEHVIEGADGFDTLKGESAYEVAVRNGFYGTEKEWLDSLQGIQGIKGDTFSYSFELKDDGHLYVTENLLSRKENESLPIK